MKNYQNFQIHSSKSRASFFQSGSQGRIKKGSTLSIKQYPFNPITTEHIPQRPFTSYEGLQSKELTITRPISRALTTAQGQTRRKLNIQREVPFFEELEKKQSKRKLQKPNAKKLSLKYLLYYLAKFQDKLRSLNPNDDKIKIFVQIMQKLFDEISIMDFNLLICQHLVTEKFYIYFSDSEWTPFSYCCNCPILVVLTVENNSFHIYCCQCLRDLKNPPPSTKELYFGDNQQAKNLYSKSQTTIKNYGHTVNEQKERLKLSKMVISGQFKHINLKDIYQTEQRIIKFQKIKNLPPFDDNQSQSQIEHNFNEPVQRKIEPEKIPEQQSDSTILEIKNIIDEWLP